MGAFEIQTNKELVLSKVHVSPETAGRMARGWIDDLTIVDSHSTTRVLVSDKVIGWSSIGACVPTDLRILVALASSLQCRWLVLVLNGPVMDQLGRYDDEVW